MKRLMETPVTDALPLTTAGQIDWPALREIVLAIPGVQVARVTALSRAVYAQLQLQRDWSVIDALQTWCEIQTDWATKTRVNPRLYTHNVQRSSVMTYRDLEPLVEANPLALVVAPVSHDSVQHAVLALFARMPMPEPWTQHPLTPVVTPRDTHASWAWSNAPYVLDYLAWLYHFLRRQDPTQPLTIQEPPGNRFVEVGAMQQDITQDYLQQPGLCRLYAKHVISTVRPYVTAEVATRLFEGIPLDHVKAVYAEWLMAKDPASNMERIGLWLSQQPVALQQAGIEVLYEKGTPVKEPTAKAFKQYHLRMLVQQAGLLGAERLPGFNFSSYYPTKVALLPMQETNYTPEATAHRLLQSLPGADLQFRLYTNMRAADTTWCALARNACYEILLTDCGVEPQTWADAVAKVLQQEPQAGLMWNLVWLTSANHITQIDVPHKNPLFTGQAVACNAQQIPGPLVSLLQRQLIWKFWLTPERTRGPVAEAYYDLANIDVKSTLARYVTCHYKEKYNAGGLAMASVRNPLGTLLDLTTGKENTPWEHDAALEVLPGADTGQWIRVGRAACAHIQADTTLSFAEKVKHLVTVCGSLQLCVGPEDCSIILSNDAEAAPMQALQGVIQTERVADEIRLLCALLDIPEAFQEPLKQHLVHWSHLRNVQRSVQTSVAPEDTLQRVGLAANTLEQWPLRLAELKQLATAPAVMPIQKPVLDLDDLML